MHVTIGISEMARAAHGSPDMTLMTRVGYITFITARKKVNGL